MNKIINFFKKFPTNFSQPSNKFDSTRQNVFKSSKNIELLDKTNIAAAKRAFSIPKLPRTPEKYEINRIDPNHGFCFSWMPAGKRFYRLI